MEQRLCRDCCDLACLEFADAAGQGVGRCAGCREIRWTGAFPVWTPRLAYSVLGWLGYAAFFLLIWLTGRGGP